MNTTFEDGSYVSTHSAEYDTTTHSHKHYKTQANQLIKIYALIKWLNCTALKNLKERKKKNSKIQKLFLFKQPKNLQIFLKLNKKKKTLFTEFVGI